MTHRTVEEVTKYHIAKMGLALGSQFDALWQDVVWLHRKWAEYLELFGTDEARITILNRAAPQFFRMVQDLLWEEIVLHIARLTDQPESMGHKNLTIKNLPDLITDAGTKRAVAAQVAIAVSEADFCRDRRNRHIAHQDLDLAINKKALPLKGGSRKQIRQALAAIVEVLHAIEDYYAQPETLFEGIYASGGTESLLIVLEKGLQAQADGKKR